MLVTYQFNLDKEDDREDLKIFQSSKKSNRIIWEFSNNVKRRISQLDEKDVEGYEKAMSDFFGLTHEVD